ncbi:MAG: DNA primase [Deltaproteobacteria bacterium]|nr:DNA primase [Deltaproteobacteria bacterium]
MPSNPSAKEEIKRAADIVQVIGQFVQLKKAGKNFMGLCPFHAEKDPSFTVSPDRQMFHCFGCKKGGDIFAFWMEYHGLTFPESLRDLAERYNIPISETLSASEEKKRTQLRESLLKINETAARYFEGGLRRPEKNNPAIDYFKKRAISKEIITQFRLGYAPDKWDGLTHYFERQQIDLKKAVQAGLVIPKKGGGYYDRFRGRVMFPIFNLREQVIGFGGRVLDDALPKYLNTPETPVFHKGEYPYGLHLSFKAIRQKGVAVIVEGYMDLLALRRYGLDEVVATLGTALTGDHVRKIKGYAREAVVVFDSDDAGKVAALRSLPLFLNEGLPAKAVVLPDGHDPDSFVNENGLPAFKKLLNGASSMFDFFLEQKLAQKDPDIEGKVRVLKEILPVLSQLRNSAQRSLYAGHLSERLGIKEDVVLAELKASRKNLSEGILQRGLKGRLTASKVEKKIGDAQLLNLLVHHPKAVNGLMDVDCGTLLSDSSASKIVEVIFDKYRREGRFSPEELEETLDSEKVRIRLREVMVADSIYSDQEVNQAVQEIGEKVRQKKFTDSIRAAKGDPEALNRLLLKSKAQGPPAVT